MRADEEKQDMYKITLKGNSISTQSAYGHSGTVRYLLPKARATKNIYTIQTRSQWRGKPKLQGDLFVYIKIYFSNKVRKDRDNFHKLSQDSMEGIVFDNDSQIKLALVEMSYDKNDPRQEIVLCHLENKKALLDYYLTMESQNLSQ